MIHVTRRVIRFWGWLLTPVVAGAASFLGAWIGALVGREMASPKAGFASIVVGAAVAGFAVTFLWAKGLRRAAGASHRLRLVGDAPSRRVPPGA